MESTVLDSTLTEIAEMLRVILGEEGFDLPITMDTTFFGDLGMASIDLVALGGRLHSRYGPSLNFGPTRLRNSLRYIRRKSAV